MKKKGFALLALIPLLGACSDFVGLSSPYYNGRAIERNEEAIAAYAEANEIIGEEKENFPTLPDFFFREALDYIGETNVWAITEDHPLVVGEHIPEGRYTVSLQMQSGYFTISDDSSDEILFQTLLNSSMPVFELNLYEGMRLTSNDRVPRGSASTIPRLLLHNEYTEPFMNFYGPETAPAPPLGEGEYKLSSGIHHVGTHIEPGRYRLVPPFTYPSGVKYAYLLNEDGTYRIFELTVSANLEKESGMDIELAEGQILYINDISSVTLTSMEE